MILPAAARETRKLKPSPTKWITLSVIFAALAAGMTALFVYSESPKDNDGFLVVGSLVLFFAAGAVLSLMNLLPDRAYLLLAPEGFTFRALFKSRSYRWGEIERFDTFSHRGANMVVFTLSREGMLRLTESGFGKFNKAISSGDDSLPDTYGMSADKLAELMNQWKEKFIH
jgi:hypothetical protein